MSREVVDVLRKARALIERGWTQGTAARNAFGEDCETNSVSAIRWCARGALTAITGGTCTGVDQLAHQALRSQANGMLVTWNDDERRTRREILALYDRAIAAEEARR